MMAQVIGSCQLYGRPGLCFSFQVMALLSPNLCRHPGKEPADGVSTLLSLPVSFFKLYRA